MSIRSGFLAIVGLLVGVSLGYGLCRLILRFEVTGSPETSSVLHVRFFGTEVFTI